MYTGAPVSRWSSATPPMWSMSACVMRIAAQRALERSPSIRQSLGPARVHDDSLAGAWTADDVAIHPKWAQFEPGDVETHPAAKSNGASRLDWRAMESWPLPEIATPDGHPLAGRPEERGRGPGRPHRPRPGPELGDHQVKEHAWLLVVEGTGPDRERGREIEASRGHARPLRAETSATRSRATRERRSCCWRPGPGPRHFRGSS